MSDLACLLPYYHTFNIISTPICYTFYHARMRPGNQEKGDFGHFLSEFRCRRYFCILYLTKLGSSYVLIKFFVKQSIVSSHTKLSSLSLQQLVLSLIINVIVAAGSLEQMDTSLPGPVSRHRQASVPAPTPDPTITKTN